MTIPIKVDNLIPTEIYESGGQVVTITGANFPVSITQAESFGDFAIKFDDNSL